MQCQHLPKQAMDMSSMAWLIGMCLTTPQPKMTMLLTLSWGHMLLARGHNQNSCLMLTLTT